MSRVKKMELLYEAYPNCPDFRRQIWEILGKVEPDRDWDDEWSWDWYRDDEHESVEELGELCDKVLSENTVADRYLKMAENSVKDQNLADAIKVMRIFIDAQICKYDKAYEQKLFGQLRWLQQMIERDIDEDVVQGVEFYDLTHCFSYYYWNDAMRCILLGTVCPKMIQQGNTTLALQLVIIHVSNHIITIQYRLTFHLRIISISQ